MKKILIVGATSYIAIGLINYLLKNDCVIYAVIRPCSKNEYKLPVNEHLKIIKLEMNDYNKLNSFLPNAMDICYYFTWGGIRGKDRNNFALQEQNLIAFQKTIQQCVLNQTKTFLGIGSWAEYGSNLVVMSEENMTIPQTEYGRCKLLAYEYGKTFTEKTEMRYIWTRLFSTYGPGENEETLIMMCIRKMLHNEAIALSPCEHRWDYIYLEDVIYILYMLGNSMEKCAIYNIASGDGRKLKDYVWEMRHVLKSSSDLKFGALSYDKPVEMYNMLPDISKLKTRYGFTPKVSFEEGIKRIVRKVENCEK